MAHTVVRTARAQVGRWFNKTEPIRAQSSKPPVRQMFSQFLLQGIISCQSGASSPIFDISSAIISRVVIFKVTTQSLLKEYRVSDFNCLLM